MIRDHVWRPTHASGTQPVSLRAECSYLSCRRPRAEHERSVRAARFGQRVSS